MSSASQTIFTIGHSNHSLETFVALLRGHGVTAVADVRSAPFSRFNPQFNKEALEKELRPLGIKYVFLGRELGARPGDSSFYVNGRVQYNRLAQSDLFRAGIDRILQGSSEHRIALMCAEKEPLECHRTLLVARALAERGIRVEHIMADGGLEQHQASMERLLDVVGLPHEDLFRSKDELIAEAIFRQEEQVAFYVEKLAAEAGKGQQ